MSETNSEFSKSLTDEERDFASETLNAWLGLGLKGCAECKVPGHFNPLFNGNTDTMELGVDVDALTHYAIELNGLKRPGRTKPVMRDRLPFNEDLLFDIALSIGLAEESLDELSIDFQDCIDCPNAISTTGSSASFEYMRQAVIERRNQLKP